MVGWFAETYIMQSMAMITMEERWILILVSRRDVERPEW